MTPRNATCGVPNAGAGQSTSITIADSHLHRRVAVGPDFELMTAIATARSSREGGVSPEGTLSMMTSLVDIAQAASRLASGEQAYAFEISDRATMVGPACGFGADYLRHLRTEGRYAETLEEANQDRKSV